jgi:FMN phosphatase YigB (HAD superfamily)
VNLSGIKHLVFDLGGVIIDLDIPATFKAFEKISGTPMSKWIKGVHESPLFLDYEQGLLSDGEFRNGLRELCAAKVPDEILDNAWNAMLGAIPTHRLEKVRELGHSYQTFVLSNTNGIHIEAFNRILLESSRRTRLEDFFHKVYFSHVMKMRKPETEIYQKLLDENDLVPEEVLFLDDKPENLKGAEKLKIQTFLVPSPDSWLELF